LPDTMSHIDVLIVVPLNEELDRLFEVFEFSEDLSIQDHFVGRVHHSTQEISICIVKLAEPGNTAARAACLEVLQRYSVGLIVSYGITGGIKKDLQLSDVCVSHNVLDLTDQGKVEDGHDGLNFSPSPRHMEVNRNLCSRLSFLETNPTYARYRDLWHENYINMLSHLEEKVGKSFDASREQLPIEPAVYFGPIVSFAVVASDVFSRRLSLIDRNVLAVDTESAGIFEIASNFSTPAITVRGVSDFADKNKNALELSTNNTIRHVAAKNAAFYLEAQLRTPTMLDFLGERKTASYNGQTEDLFRPGTKDPLDTILYQAAEAIHSQLQETCPAYRHKPKGTILPTPRLLRTSAPPATDEKDDWDLPREVPAMVEQFDRITVALEHTYPDQALPWVLADIVLRTNGARLYVPFVVDGESVSPNRFSLQSIEGIEHLLSLGESKAVPVLIVDDPNLQSKTRVGALIDEANQYPSVKVVVIAKKHGAPILVENFSKQFGAETFAVADFSLGALSNFVSSNFGIELPQAAVLATKINETFEQFNMHAHPSYFAGISAEVLAGIISANRRGELIQLAVDGALMILVATDDAEVHVSKSWRREFLKDVVVRQFVFGQDIGEMRAIELAREMAERRDIDIKPLEFVQSFVTTGIVRFDRGAVQFNLVYVRDYLIAEYLHENPDAAKSYFDFDAVGSDFNVLDIYAELGVDEELVNGVAGLIESDLEFLAKRDPTVVDNLIDNKVRFSGATSFGRLAARRKGLAGAIRYVGENDADLQRKQQLLDLQKAIARRAAREANEEAGEEENSKEDKECGADDAQSRVDGSKDEKVEDIPRASISAHWSAACVLLGSGAERMEAEPKRRLARGLIGLGCRIAEYWTAERASVDFDKIRSAILEEESFRERRKQMDRKVWEKLERDVDQFIHIWEYSFITGPYRTVLSSLCGQGQGNVLRKSVKEVTLDRDFERLTQAIWATEMEPEHAQQRFHKWLKPITGSIVLQFVVVEHFIARVYWDKWRRTDREAFLEVASNVMEGLGEHLDKGRAQRAIQMKSKKRKKRKRRP